MLECLAGIVPGIYKQVVMGEATEPYYQQSTDTHFGVRVTIRLEQLVDLDKGSLEKALKDKIHVVHYGRFPRENYEVNPCPIYDMINLRYCVIGTETREGKQHIIIQATAEPQELL